MCSSQNVNTRFGVLLYKNNNMDKSVEQFVAFDNSQSCESSQAEDAQDKSLNAMFNLAIISQTR